MKSLLHAVCLTAALGLTGIAQSALAADAKLPPSAGDALKALAEAGKPSAEHQKLQPLVGDWNLTLKMWTDASQPPAELHGTVQRKWIMGGRFVQETVKGEYEGKPFEGMGLWGYDAAQKKFTTVRACGLCGMMASGLSDFDASKATFECATEGVCPRSGETVKGRDEVILEGDDKIVMNVFKTIGGKEIKAMEIVSTRKK
jgi:Protein of unknown function (DUF1579)